MGTKAYFFQGDSYVRYDRGDDRVDDGYPLKIADTWVGTGAGDFGSSLDTALNLEVGFVYFFRGANYVRYDMTNDAVDPGYPLPIADQWPGMATAGFATGLSAAVDVFDGRDVWLPSARRNAPPVNGPQFIALPWRGVLHTTEGGTLSGAEQAFAAGKDWPNLAIDPDRLDIVEYYPLSRGARALTDNLTPQNAARCVQIEIVGLAQESPDWAPERLAFIRDVMRQIEDLVPIPRTTDRTFLDLAGVNHNPGNRMSVDEWKRFSGWCGHQHVPGNTHWDPGAIDIDTLLKT